MEKENKRVQAAAAVVAGMAAFLAPFMSNAVNIALPSIGRDFSASAVSLGWVASVYLLAAAVFLVPFGRLADIHGRKKIFVWGLLTYTVASLLSGLAPSILALIVFRIWQGIGGAMIFGTGVAILTSVYPPGERGRALGINVAATYLGLSLGPVLGGLLTQHLGWRSIFYVNIPLGLLAAGIVFWRLKGEWAEAGGETFDVAGSLLFGLALVGLMLGFSRLPQGGAFWLLLGGLGLLGAFIFYETRVPAPVLNMGLFLKNRVFAFSNLAALVNYSATFAVGFFVSLYLQYVKGMSPEGAGLILIAQPVVMTLFSPFAGRASDRIEPRLVASAGMALSSGGLFLLAWAGAGTSLVFVGGSLAVLGFGFALFSSPNTNAVMSSVGKKYLSVAAATLGTMRLTGQMFSMAIAMMLFALYVGQASITSSNQHLFLHSARTGFFIFSALCFLGVFASLARGNRNQV